MAIGEVILTDGPTEGGGVVVDAVAVDGTDNDGSDYEPDKADEVNCEQGH